MSSQQQLSNANGTLRINSRPFTCLIDVEITKSPPFCEPFIGSQSTSGLILKLFYLCLNVYIILFQNICLIYERTSCPYNPSRSLRSSNLNLLTIPRSRLKHRGDRAFRWWALDCGIVCLYNLEWPTLYQFLHLSLKLIFSLAFNVLIC